MIMNKMLNPKDIPAAVGLMGIGALLLRLLVALLAVDHRGLILTGHILVIILWVLTGLTAVLVTLPVLGLGGSRKYAVNFPASAAAAVGCGVMAVCTMVTAALDIERSGIGYLHYGLGLAAGSSLIFLTYARYRGIKPSFLFHTIVCAFLTVHMVSCYRSWSGSPQLLDYVFEMFACVGMMLYAYHQAAFEVGLGKRRVILWLGLMTGYCALAAVPGASSPLLCAGGAVWTLTTLCSLTPPPRRKKAAPEAPRTENNETA